MRGLLPVLGVLASKYFGSFSVKEFQRDQGLHPQDTAAFNGKAVVFFSCRTLERWRARYEPVSCLQSQQYSLQNVAVWDASICYATANCIPWSFVMRDTTKCRGSVRPDCALQGKKLFLNLRFHFGFVLNLIEPLCPPQNTVLRIALCSSINNLNKVVQVNSLYFCQEYGKLSFPVKRRHSQAGSSQTYSIFHTLTEWSQENSGWKGSQEVSGPAQPRD